MNDQNELFQNGSAIELLAILREQGMNETAKDMLGALVAVSAMDRRLETALTELREMKQELAGMREEANHPLKTACQNAIRSLEKGISDMSSRLSKIKTSITEAAKDAVAAFKEKGVSALNALAGFFRIKNDLTEWRRELQGYVRSEDKAIAKIAAVSGEIHELGRDVRNLGRAVIGRERREDKKPFGKLAKLAQAPHRASKSLYLGLDRRISKAIDRLEKMERSAKPSLLAGMEAMKNQSAKQPKAPKADRPKMQEASI